MCRAYWGPYAISKAALNAMVQTWAAENMTTNLRVNLLTPGPIRTRMRAQAMPGEDPKTLETPDKVAGPDRGDVPARLHRDRQGLCLAGEAAAAVPSAGLRHD